MKMIKKIALLLSGVLILGTFAGCCAVCPSRTHEQQQQSAKEGQKELGQQ
jgi:hypothetical protein